MSSTLLHFLIFIIPAASALGIVCSLRWARRREGMVPWRHSERNPFRDAPPRDTSSARAVLVPLERMPDPAATPPPTASPRSDSLPPRLVIAVSNATSAGAETSGAATPTKTASLSPRQVTGGTIAALDELLQAGDEFLAARDFERALLSFDRAVETNPNNPDAHVKRGFAYSGVNRFDNALASYDEALKLNPAHARAHLCRANLLKRLGRDEEALESYRRASGAT